MRSSILASLILSLACTAAFAGPAQAAVRDCPAKPGYVVHPTSVRNMSCASAARVLKRLKVVPVGNGARVSIRGWNCVVARPPYFRCVSGARAFRSFYLD